MCNVAPIFSRRGSFVASGATSVNTSTRDYPKLTVSSWNHPAYSLDLAPIDFWIFPVLKSALKGRRFDTLHEAIYQEVAKFDSVFYRDVFAQWIRRHEKCVSCSGDYIEK